MNILLVTDLYPLFENEAGIPLTVKDFALGFEKEGCTVKVFRPNFMLNVFLRGRKLYRNGKYADKGSNIQIFNKNFLFPFRRNSVIRACKKYFKDEKFDVILAHMPSGILCADIISKAWNIPMLGAVHASDIKVLSDIKYVFFKQRMIEAYKNCKCILPRSFWLRDKIKKLIPGLEKPCEIIYSGVPIKIIEQNEKIEPKKFNSKKAKILTVSSLIKRKNINSLILAFKKLQKKYPNISLEIIGDGKLREKLEIINVKSKACAKFLGRLPKDEVFKKMRESDIFILPSKKETFGMVYMEALSSGMVVCCTKNSGIDGILKDGENGFLIKPDKKNIHKALEKILKLKPKGFEEISKNALITAKMFSYENSIKNYLEKIELFRL